MAAGAAAVLRQDAFFSSASRKLLLQARAWRPQDKPERAALVWSHHFGDHSGRLDFIGGTLASNGITLIAHDTQGWGRSENFLMYKENRASYHDSHYTIQSEDQMVADFDKLTTKVMQFYTAKGGDTRYPLSRMLRDKLNPWDPEPPIAPKIPIFVAGHGMGAPVVARYVVDRAQPDFDKNHAVKAVLLAQPWIGHLPTISLVQRQRLVKEMMLRYLPYSKTLGKEPDPTAMFEDLEEVVKWEQDAEITKTAIPPHTVAVLERISKQAKEILPSIAKPTVVMAGTADPLCPMDVCEAVHEGLTGTAEKALVDIPDAKHDIFRSSGATGQRAVIVMTEYILEMLEEWVPPQDPWADMEEARRTEILKRFDEA
eukprot:TRINITY_DN1867_c1_g3_i1.p1 TRINITY_DN1867_c1_g3~~TRINITY_DN1867_c1_g3_i1.p1  ORF type:complete len:394 (+),score=154.63 TRINITY_DN1867_c1_g3_i1:71-1183(+)